MLQIPTTEIKAFLACSSCKNNYLLLILSFLHLLCVFFKKYKKFQWSSSLRRGGPRVPRPPGYQCCAVGRIQDSCSSNFKQIIKILLKFSTPYLYLSNLWTLVLSYFFGYILTVFHSSGEGVKPATLIFFN